ncbi:diguanylate cyclase [Actinoplanes sp. N902-109]|uniref:GGDEF domain-containing protein n=1 Tax=Actinoplanes sp. (strain N902-109) TaxID=649831 RepID=UPI0003295498|nr:GGDEF domain-containing protein [Actinoplanes sp. N902-109]AGL20883.1 diguanylate cyclase [Actinoplanes sp. N902-109]
MPAEGLPALLLPYGPFAALALHVHDLTIQGRQAETLTAADHAEGVATVLGDLRTVRSVRLGRMYALTALGRLQEALAVGEQLVSASLTAGPRSTDAKILADTAEVLLRMGRIDDGLVYLARAMVLLETAPRGSVRYVSAMSSLCEAAKVAELFELADECLRVPDDVLDFSDLYRSSADLQRAELRLEWGLRLEQVGRVEEAARLYESSVTLLERWAGLLPDAPLASALLALGMAKTGRYAEALGIVHELLLRMRQEGQDHESRLLHLAHGVVLRDTGDLRGARREFVAADQLAYQPDQRLIYRYELAVLATLELPGEAAQAVLAALRDQIDMLWRLRLDRRTMVRQAYRRVELEAARAGADRAATSDALTGLGNRRIFDRRMGSLAGLSALLLIDVDRFKTINDDFSHSVGDRVLAEIAGVLRAHCRADEEAVRLGGDEFALFLSASEREGRQVAEQIRQVILARDWSAIAPGLRVTLSMGLAACRPGESGHDLYDRADAHLYAAKRAGRNRLTAA